MGVLDVSDKNSAMKILKWKKKNNQLITTNKRTMMVLYRSPEQTDLHT